MVKDAEKISIWEELKGAIKKEPLKKKIYVFEEPSFFRKKKKKTVIRNGKDYFTLLFWFFGVSFLPSLFRKDYIAALKLLIAQMFPLYVLLNALLLKSKPIMSLAIITMVISCFINIHYVKVNNPNRIRRYKKLKYKELA